MLKVYIYTYSVNLSFRELVYDMTYMTLFAQKLTHRKLRLPHARIRRNICEKEPVMYNNTDRMYDI